MYGQFQAMAAKSGVFGPSMCVGHTLGEEVIFCKGKQFRTESVVAKVASCVLQVRKDILFNLRRLKDRTANNGLATKDFTLMRLILESHFEQKNEWRDEAGLFNESNYFDKSIGEEPPAEEQQ